MCCRRESSESDLDVRTWPILFLHLLTVVRAWPAVVALPRFKQYTTIFNAMITSDASVLVRPVHAEDVSK